MNLPKQIATHFRDVHFGGNWTDVNLKTVLADINWKEATRKVYNLNTIATLVFHMNYYVTPVLKVLQGDPLNASDKFCFDVPAITNAADWEQLVNKSMNDATIFAAQIEQMDEAKLFADFADPKYGSYYKNLHGIIEHTHYHLGQISLIKKIIRENKEENDIAAKSTESKRVRRNSGERSTTHGKERLS